MKSKKIYAHELDKLQTAINEAEGRATQRCLSAEACQDKLNKCSLCGMPKSKLKGCKVTLHGSTERMPSSYRYPSMCTHVMMHHDGKGWVFDSANRDYIRVRTSSVHGVEYVLTDEAKTWLIDNFSWY
jgi:hypothetical protein